MKKINPLIDERTIQLKKLIEELKGAKFSCRKLSELFNKKYGKTISKTTINRILRNKLGLRFLKTSPKNDILVSKQSLKQSFFVLKILTRHIKLGGNVVYIDESTFSTVNNNYKIWRLPNSQIYSPIKDSKKFNLILAVNNEKIIHWMILEENTTSEIFKKFFLEMLNKMNKIEIKKTLFF